MTDQVTVSRELLRQILGYVEEGNPGHIADKINVLVKLREALEQPAVEPIYWSAVLDPEQVPQQLNKRLHLCGFRHKRDAEAFIETELDFNGWRYTLVPLYAAPQAQQPAKCAQCGKEYTYCKTGRGCPKCAPGLVVPESEFQQPITAPKHSSHNC